MKKKKTHEICGGKEKAGPRRFKFTTLASSSYLLFMLVDILCLVIYIGVCARVFNIFSPRLTLGIREL